MSTLESALQAAPTPNIALPVDETGSELKRGAVFNTIALLASNLRGVFTFLVARLLGPAALGTFSVAWANIDLISKFAVVGLDNAVTTLIARSQATDDLARSRTLFRAAVVLVLTQSSLVAAIAIAALQIFGDRLQFPREMLSALAFVLCALPGISLYRVCTSVSRGMKVMKHDIFSRGMTEPAMTTLALLIALGFGFTRFAPEVAAVSGTAASGIVAFIFASKLFRGVTVRDTVSIWAEAKPLLAYAAPISVYQIFNTFILRLDVIMLGWFIGRAPGVTLATVGVYSVTVEVASGLRKVNQAFNPIFTPVVAGMTATGDQQRAEATYARLAEWILWILLPLVAVMTLAGSVILLIYGPAFRQGGAWLAIVGIACATNAFVSLGETVIMVQRPHLNLLNSSVTCAVAFGANLWLIPRFGAMGAAFGILLPYVIQGILRYGVLRLVFRWRNPWSSIRPPIFTAIIALVPAVICRVLLHGIAGQVTGGLVFLAIFGVGWLHHRRSVNLAS
ncbi:MAG: oligosaccharide flippase family protein [Chthoniobacterales bacterium]